jgi:hypothetical protein
VVLGVHPGILGSAGNSCPQERDSLAQPRPMKGILVAITVRKGMFASSGKPAM